MAPSTCALAARRHQRRAPARLLLMGALCAAVRLTSIAPSAFFAPPPVDQPPISELPVAESEAKEDSVTPQRSRMDNALKGPRFLKVALGFEEFVAVLKKRAELEEKAQVRILTAEKGEYYPYSQKPRKVVFVAGEEKNVLAALQEILPGDGNANMTTFFVVPKWTRGFLLRDAGEMMQKIQASTQAFIGLEHAGLEELVKVRGSSRAAAAVAEDILSAQAQAHLQHNISDSFTINYLGCRTRGMQSQCDVFATIPAGQLGRFIGKNGDTKNIIQRMFAVKIEVDRKLKTADGSGIIKITGALGDVHAAHLYVFSKFLSPWSQSGRDSE